MRSSNIGSAHIGQLIGSETQKNYMKQLGLLSASPLEIVENGVPLVPQNWSHITTELFFLINSAQYLSIA